MNDTRSRNGLWPHGLSPVRGRRRRGARAEITRARTKTISAWDEAGRRRRSRRRTAPTESFRVANKLFQPAIDNRLPLLAAFRQNLPQRSHAGFEFRQLLLPALVMHGELLVQHVAELSTKLVPIGAIFGGAKLSGQRLGLTAKFIILAPG